MTEPDDAIAPTCTRDEPVSPSESEYLCAQCGTPIDNSDWRPVDTRVDDTGEVTIYLFCDNECKADWTATDD